MCDTEFDSRDPQPNMLSRFVEVLEQNDGALCALQLSIVLGNIVFWGAWAYVSVTKQVITEIPTGLGIFLAAGYTAKVWKDIADNSNSRLENAALTAAKSLAATILPSSTTVATTTTTTTT